MAFFRKNKPSPTLEFGKISPLKLEVIANLFTEHEGVIFLLKKPVDDQLEAVTIAKNLVAGFGVASRAFELEEGKYQVRVGMESPKNQYEKKHPNKDFYIFKEKIEYIKNNTLNI